MHRSPTVILRSYNERSAMQAVTVEVKVCGSAFVAAWLYLHVWCIHTGKEAARGFRSPAAHISSPKNVA